MNAMLRLLIGLGLLSLTWACSSAILPCQPTGEELCNQLDDDCDGQTDEGFSVGEPCDGPDSDQCANGVLACTEDGTGTECVDDEPSDITEVCNGEDDDCDGQTDEDLERCACSGGGSPGPESCNNTDDDCNGQVDDGLSACQCTDGEPGQELCDGVDNDCNGVVDDGFDVGQPCDGPDPDSCANGTLTCTADGTGTECTGEELREESCNNIDDDCDGQTDEDLERCACSGGGSPGPESCNNTDDDCNGEVDDGLSSCACSNGGSPDVESCNGIDDDCNGTIDDLPDCQCTGGAAPTQEICDGIDNDCNGQADESNGSGGSCNGFGAPCSSYRDCTSQICVGDDFARYCSEECDVSNPSSWPDGYRCIVGPNADYLVKNYPPCGSDDDCPGGVCTVQEADDQLSLVTECRPPLAGGGAPGDSCSGTNECRNKLCIWSMGVCSEVCSDVADCDTDYLGYPTTCVLGWQAVYPGDCGRDAQCPSGYTCQGGKCQGPSCSSDTDCTEPGYSCQAINNNTPPDRACLPAPFFDYVGQCRIGCAGDPDCPPGMWCYPAVLVDRSAVQGYCRNQPTDPTTDTGSGPCANAGDLPCSHAICYGSGASSYCTQLCEDATDCPTGMNCTPGTLNMGSLGSFPNTYTCTW